jgi:RimJ/RimL family protein N-acetyltransferase
MTAPAIRKAAELRGANLVLRDATEADAAFIHDLRTDPVKSRYLSPTSSRVEDQAAWLRAYAAREDQAYFIICDREYRPLGCIRLYEPQGDSFSWGSWLMVNGQAPMTSIEAVLLVYAYARQLGFASARIDVRRDNESVARFHEKFFGARRAGETGEDIHYVLDADRIDTALRKFAALLTSPLDVKTSA